jgi:hypothetical protein
MTTAPLTEEKRREAALLAELEATLQRESFWLARGEMNLVLEALPVKNDLIAALQACHANVRAAGQGADPLAPRLARLSQWQAENCRHFTQRKEELATALRAVGEALQRLRGWGKPAAPASCRMEARWA